MAIFGTTGLPQFGPNGLPALTTDCCCSVVNCDPIWEEWIGYPQLLVDTDFSESDDNWEADRSGDVVTVNTSPFSPAASLSGQYVLVPAVFGQGGYSARLFVQCASPNPTIGTFLDVIYTVASSASTIAQYYDRFFPSPLWSLGVGYQLPLTGGSLFGTGIPAEFVTLTFHEP